MLAVGAVTAVVVAGSSGDDSASPVVVPKGVSTGGPRIGEPAPDFTLTTLDGKTVKLSDYRGKPVVLNFWRSDCNPCRKEFPLFRQQLAEHPGEFVLLGVDTLNDIEADAKDFVKNEKAKWPIGVDSARSDVAEAYGVAALPQTFFIKPNGKVALRYFAQIPDSKWNESIATITQPTEPTRPTKG